MTCDTAVHIRCRTGRVLCVFVQTCVEGSNERPNTVVVVRTSVSADRQTDVFPWGCASSTAPISPCSSSIQAFSCQSSHLCVQGMSSAEDGQLCLNISHSSSSSSSFRRKPVSAQQRWAVKKQRAEKRRFSSSSEVKGHSFKKRREEPEAPPPEVKGHLSQAPPPEDTDWTPEKKKKMILKKEKDEGAKEAGRSSVKTSSLFKHNPQIPQMDRPVVSPLKEQIFSSASFSDLDLHPHLVATLDKVLNVSTLTSVQKQTVPVLLSGRDAVVRSQTGSGKTLSYAVPLVQSLQSVRPKVSRSDGPLAVVIVPTRELALQTFQTFQKLLKPFTWIVPGVLMGGEKRKAEKARLRKGINILVSTPGRLVDHIKHTLSLVFSAVRWLILDEADRTLDLGFEKDLTVIFNSLNSKGPSRQNVLLSATLTSGVTRLADICLNDPVTVHVSGPASFDSTTTPAVKPDPDPADQPESFAIPEALQQFVVVVPSKIRLVCLAAFILDKCKFSQGNKLIVFASSCEMVEFLHSLFSSVLCRPSANHQAELSFLRLHGNMKQEERSDVFQQFSASRSGVLLCTDVAARGLHLPQVTWIVQFTPPTAAADYVHRVGRTARIGHRGSSLLFLTPAENAFITELANHNISLSEMKLLDILSSLMMDDAYRGRGKYHSQSSSKAREQEIRERATVLQTEFENVVHADAQSVQMAKSALQSFLRAYAAYPARLKHIFHIRSLHLGHAAKSFGLRDAPQGLSVATATHNRKLKNRHQNQRQRTGKQNPGPEAPAEKRFPGGQRESHLVCSEFSSGLDTSKKKKKKKRKALTGQTGEGEEPE
ncbi:probable ATP-dependent RNA helicase DDX31 isoform X2 [Sphaeramia orbicularis]|uniref:probable ATP-dependent RNA helicase DDX31 isoform X2 n=1 Tax=Sphaeramia orbicularis TaxID=375764 RepID=UPI00117DA8E3|nr:probable ATP-dependent RNA helicase DDX31 isoform X2 [Sphaeramia orbicularis]